MSKENTALTSSSYTVTEGKPCPWIMESVRAMPDERLLPQTISYGAVPDRRFSFINPVQLVLSVEAEMVIAHSLALQVFGYGANVTEALDDFGKTLGELYLSLRKEKGRLSEALAQQLGLVEEYLKFTEHETQKPAHEGSEGPASLREASSAESQVRQPVGIRRGQAAGEDAHG